MTARPTRRPTLRPTQGIAAAAILIGVITILARVTGFGKQLALARTVGVNCLSTAYFTANQVPNLVFEVVAGGALAGMVVPVLAGAAGRAIEGRPAGAGEESASGAQARALVGRITSALLTWVLVALVPLCVLTALAAGPLIRLFTGGEVSGCGTGEVVTVATRMLRVFAPQIPLYGLAVVLYGVLQSYRRFTAPALAPLVSSVVVIGAYLTFPVLSDGVKDPGGLPRPAELALSVGTTLGVLAMVVTVVGPASRLRLSLRPTLRFPPGVGRQVRRLALAGLSALVAQQLAMAFVVALANRQVGGGALVAYNFAWAVYQVPYAVLAVPIATSAFPSLSAHAEEGREGAFAGLAAQTTRAVLIVSGLAAGVLAAVAVPVAGVFLEGMPHDVPVADFARSIALFAPGLIGYGLIAQLSRVLYACGRGRAAATGMVTGWVTVMVAQAVFAVAFPPAWKLGRLGGRPRIGGGRARRRGGVPRGLGDRGRRRRRRCVAPGGRGGAGGRGGPRRRRGRRGGAGPSRPAGRAVARRLQGRPAANPGSTGSRRRATRGRAAAGGHRAGRLGGHGRHGHGWHCGPAGRWLTGPAPQAYPGGPCRRRAGRGCDIRRPERHAGQGAGDDRRDGRCEGR